MAELYLIAHLVRGLPTFDIAEQLHVEALGETFWIIPTSGHRAHPFWHVPLDDLQRPIGPDADDLGSFDYDCPFPPTGHPDHYACNNRSVPKGLTNLAAALGIKREEVKRRV